MKASILFVLACVLAGCQLTNYVPTVTSHMATARKGQSVNLAMLHEGRTLFAHRCIECHTLPVVWRYSSKDWPNIDFVARRLNRPWPILRELGCRVAS